MRVLIVSTGYIKNMDVARATAAAARWRFAEDIVVRNTSMVSLLFERRLCRWGVVGGGWALA